MDGIIINIENKGHALVVVENYLQAEQCYNSFKRQLTSPIVIADPSKTVKANLDSFRKEHTKAILIVTHKFLKDIDTLYDYTIFDDFSHFYILNLPLGESEDYMLFTLRRWIMIFAGKDRKKKEVFILDKRIHKYPSVIKMLNQFFSVKRLKNEHNSD